MRVRQTPTANRIKRDPRSHGSLAAGVAASSADGVAAVHEGCTSFYDMRGSADAYDARLSRSSLYDC
eukprot:1152292-Prymnesium_polylepis.1